MKVVAFNGSPRVDGNTTCLINHVFAPLQAAGIETEMVQIGRQLTAGCKACYHCFQTKDGRCVQTEDTVNSCVEKMLAADGKRGQTLFFAAKNSV